MTQRKDYYRLPDEVILDDFKKMAVLAASTDDGGVHGGGDKTFERKADFLHGVLLSRLAGKKPPFNYGDDVEATEDIREKGGDGSKTIHGKSPSQSVHDVWFLDGNWYLDFGDKNEDGAPLMYAAEKFEATRFIVSAG